MLEPRIHFFHTCAQLLNTPSIFKQELDLKLNAQKKYLEDVLVELGYEGKLHF